MAMPNIDLIPVDYRNWLSQRSVLRRYLLAFVLVNGLVLSLGLMLQRYTGELQQRAAELQQENAITQQQQDQLQQLGNRQAEYERQWSLLRGLRAGAAIDEIFTLIDAALVAGELWFLEWSFQRAGITVNGEQRGIETGYFIIVDEDGNAPKDIEVETHMTIHGQAKDHEALSRFVRALFEQQEVSDVNVQKTSQTNYANGRVVEFDLTVVLNSSFRES